MEKDCQFCAKFPVLEYLLFARFQIFRIPWGMLQPLLPLFVVSLSLFFSGY